MKGRKPKPTALRVLEGVPGHRPLPKNEPKPRPQGPQTPPSWLSPLAQRYYKAAAPRLQRIGCFTENDPEMLASWAEACAMRDEASEALQKAGGQTYVNEKGVEVTRPQLVILRNALELVKALSAEFGMSPSSRTRIAVKPPVEDDLDKLLGGRIR